MIGRWWPRAAAGRGVDEAATPSEVERLPGSPAADPTASPEQPTRDGASTTGEGEPVPEQPVPLPALPDARPARVGVVLPARSARSRAALPALPVPAIPKRAILAVGICAGLAAPTLTRQLAGRALMAVLGADRPVGRWERERAGRETATLEIIRVTYSGQRRGDAAALVGKLLDQIRR